MKSLPMKKELYTYCSFVGPNGFLGALILRGDLSAEQAIDRAWKLKLNPGGEVLMATFTPEQVPEPQRSLYMANIETRLLTENELRETGHKTSREHDQESSN